MKTIVAALALLIIGINHPASAAIRGVDHVDVAQYLGTWFQIARNPLFFEQGCVCAVQKLGANADGSVAVLNSCNMNTPDGELRTIAGTATSEDPVSNSRFSVDFGLPHKGEYWIIGIDPSYRFAVVSDPTEKSLYILSKTPTLDPGLYQEAVRLASLQTDTSKLQMTLQNGCAYP